MEGFSGVVWGVGGTVGFSVSGFSIMGGGGMERVSVNIVGLGDGAGGAVGGVMGLGEGSGVSIGFGAETDVVVDSLAGVAVGI